MDLQMPPYLRQKIQHSQCNQPVQFQLLGNLQQFPNRHRYRSNRDHSLNRGNNAKENHQQRSLSDRLQAKIFIKALPIGLEQVYRRHLCKIDNFGLDFSQFVHDLHELQLVQKRSEPQLSGRQHRHSPINNEPLHDALYQAFQLFPCHTGHLRGHAHRRHHSLHLHLQQRTRLLSRGNIRQTDGKERGRRRFEVDR